MQAGNQSTKLQYINIYSPFLAWGQRLELAVGWKHLADIKCKQRDVERKWKRSEDVQRMIN